VQPHDEEQTTVQPVLHAVEQTTVQVLHDVVQP